jgi:magnesium and cobalt transporter
MLEGAIAVSDIQVRDIMVPRSEMVCIRREDPLASILPRVITSGHSRFPVVDGDKDDVVGILLAKDLLRISAEAAATRFDMREYLRPVVFVPESKRLNVLLREFRGKRNHMAIVVDVIEQIVGDIDDEYDIEDDQEIRRDADREFTVRGSTRIEDFNEYFGIELADEEFDTIAGLVIQQFGRMPRRGESAQIAGMEFRVLRADRRRIDSLRVVLGPTTPVPKPPAES